MSYPSPPCHGGVNERLHGVDIEDPYRSLETLASDDTQRFIKEQNELSAQILYSHPSRRGLEELVHGEYTFQRTTCPMLQGDGYYYWLHNEGTWSRDAMLRSKNLERDFGRGPTITNDEDGPELFFDPNSEDFTSLYAYTWSSDGKYFCAVLQKSGADWQNIRIIDTSTKRAVETDLVDSKFTFGACFIGNSGILYKSPVVKQSVNGDMTSPQELGKADGRYGIWYHHIGTPQSSDELLWPTLGDQTSALIPSRFEMCSRDANPSSGARRWIFFSIAASTDPVAESYLFELPRGFEDKYGSKMGQELAKLARGAKCLAKGFTGKNTYIGTLSDDTHLFHSTTDGATRGRILALTCSAFDATTPGGVLTLEERVPEDPTGLQTTAAHLVNDSVILVVSYLHACATITIFNARTGLLTGITNKTGSFGHVYSERNTEIPLPPEELPNSSSNQDATIVPAHATVSKVSSRPDSSDFYVSVDTFVAPPYVLSGKIIQSLDEYDVKMSRLDQLAPEQDLVSNQEFYSSFDGQRIPVFICHRRNLDLDSPRPLLLHAYGGYNVMMSPTFNPFFSAYMRHLDGIVAVACIRGGGEYGKEWHRCATGVNRSICFDDFCHAARHLHRRKLSTPALTATFGTSNGGLLMAACTNRSPSLFGAVLCDAGIYDLTRFHLFNLGRLWLTEFGSPDNPAELPAIHSFSPYHNINANDEVVYPAVLLTTGDHDTRVAPGNTLKHIALLQHRKAKNPNLFMARVYENAGHEMGSKSVAQKVEQTVDRLVFYILNLNLSTNIGSSRKR